MNSFALYDRWADAYSADTESVTHQIARGLCVAAYLANQVGNVGSAWRSADPNPVINFPNRNPTLTTPGTARLTAYVNGNPLDLSDAQIVWESFGAQPRFGQTATISRNSVGESSVEAEAVLPDGRRVFGATTVYVNDPINGGQPLPADSATVALYHLDNNFNDSETVDPAHPHNLTIESGSVSYSDNTTWMQPRSGKVANFGGVGNRLTATIPDGDLRPTGSTGFTIEFRIYVKSVPDTGGVKVFL